MGWEINSKTEREDDSFAKSSGGGKSMRGRSCQGQKLKLGLGGKEGAGKERSMRERIIRVYLGSFISGIY